MIVNEYSCTLLHYCERPEFMKHVLPFIFLFSFICLGLSAQTSVSERFALEKDRAQSAPHTIKIFPNPAVDYISIDGEADIERLVIYSLIGRKMKTFRTRNGDKYDVTDLPKGMYLVQFLAKGDHILTTRRLQKQ